MMSRFALVMTLASLLVPAAIYGAETKDIQFKLKNANPVVFSHTIHLSKYNNNCRICHNAIFDIRKRRHFTMAEMEKTKACGACHTGVKAFSVSSDKDCVRCHTGKQRTITFRIKGVSEATFSHEKHLAKLGGKCRSCHNGKTIITNGKPVTMAEMERGKTCGACHNGKTAFSVKENCGSCHKGLQPKDVVFKTQGITNATFSHKLHLDMDYKCSKCHTAVFPYKAVSGKFTMGDMDKGKACGICHNGKDAFSTAGDCEKCHKAFKPGDITFKTDGGPVKFSHDFHLGMYKCPDCHTKVFPFKAGAQHIGMGGMEQGKSCGNCHNGKDAFSVKGDCEKCHKM